MIRSAKMRYYQFLEQWRKKGLLPAIKFTVYRCEEAVPVEKDLATLKALQHPRDTDGLELVEFGAGHPPLARLSYPLKSRREKMFLNLAKGYRSFVLIRDGEVIGDVWCVTHAGAAENGIRCYLRWFGIELGPDEAYLFDLQVSPDAQGKSLAAYFMGSVLHRLRDNGFTKAYGYFDANNVPALWVHRQLGYRERPRLTVRKVFSHVTASSVP